MTDLGDDFERLCRLGALFIGVGPDDKKRRRNSGDEDSDDDILFEGSSAGVSTQEEKDNDEAYEYSPGTTLESKSKFQIATERQKALHEVDMLRKQIQELEALPYVRQRRYKYIAGEAIELLETVDPPGPVKHPTENQPTLEVDYFNENLKIPRSTDGVIVDGKMLVSKRLNVPDVKGNFMRVLSIDFYNLENNQRRIEIALIYDDNIDTEFYIYDTMEFLTDFDLNKKKYTYVEKSGRSKSDVSLRNIEHFFRYQGPEN